MYVRFEESYLLNIDAMTRTTEDQASSHSFREPSSLIAYLLLIFLGKIHKVVILRPNEEGNGSLVETTTLSVPFFDAVKCRLASQVEHEKNGDGVIAHKGKHVHELALPAEIPYRKGNFGVTNRDGLLHEIDACALVLISTRSIAA